jgi:hypothetical protein
MTKCVLFISFFHFSKQNVYSSCCCYSDEGGFGCMSSRCFSFLPDRELCAIVSRVWTWQFHYISSQTKWKNQTCFDSTALQRKLTRLFEKLLHCSSHFASSRVSNFIILLLCWKTDNLFNSFLQVIYYRKRTKYLSLFGVHYKMRVGMWVTFYWVQQNGDLIGGEFRNNTQLKNKWICLLWKEVVVLFCYRLMKQSFFNSLLQVFSLKILFE